LRAKSYCFLVYSLSISPIKSPLFISHIGEEAAEQKSLSKRAQGEVGRSNGRWGCSTLHRYELPPQGYLRNTEKEKRGNGENLKGEGITRHQPPLLVFVNRHLWPEVSIVGNNKTGDR